MSDPAYLSLEKLRLSYGDTVAVEGLDLAIGKGELVALLGPSGCGKTTTMRAIAGLLSPTGGTIRLVSYPPEAEGPSAGGGAAYSLRPASFA